MWKASIKDLLLKSVHYIFLALFFLLAIFGVLEIIKPRLVLDFISLPWFIGALFICAAIDILFYQKEQKDNAGLDWNKRLTVILFSILCGIFIFYWLRGLGWLSIPVGICGALTVYFSVIKNIQSYD